MNRHKRYYPEESDQILFELELKFLIMAIERRVKFINDANLDDKDNIEEPPKMTNLGLFCPKGLFQMVF